MTETCDDARPPLIVHVATTPAPAVDRAVLDPRHAALAAEDLLPARHLVDAASIDADSLAAAVRPHGVELIGPVPKDNQWQARTDGAFTIEAFQLEWERQVAACPAGHSSRRSAACTSSSTAPASCLAIQTRIRVRERS